MGGVASVSTPCARNVTLRPEISSREFLRGIGPDLTEGWVIMRGLGELSGGGSEAHGHDNFMNQIGGVRSDHCASENLAGLLCRHELHEAIRFPDGHGFAVIVEGVLCDPERLARFPQLPFAGTAY